MPEHPQDLQAPAASDNLPAEATPEWQALTSDERQLLRLWMVLIDGTVPTTYLDEAWATARTIQAVYARMLDQRFAEGREAAIADSATEAKQVGYSDGWNEATLDVLMKLPMPAHHEGEELGLPPDTPSTVS